MNLLAIYKNGNYRVRIYDDGTKIKETILDEDDELIAEFPESIDLKITNKCDMNCPMCHENSHRDGEHGDITLDFIKTIHPYTEVAIGGGNPLEHPDLLNLLTILKENKVIVNMTINQLHYMNNRVLIENLLRDKLIYGLGVSYSHYDNKFIKCIKKNSNIVLHVIAGMISIDELEKLYDKNLKLLILGYKKFRKGESLYYSYINECIINRKINTLKIYLPEIIKHFEVVSFDNLGITQLNVKSILSNNEWNNFYQGDDGSHTFYIDMVERKFAKNSISTNRYDILNNVDDMFHKLRLSV